MNTDDINLSKYPEIFTVGQVKEILTRTDDEARQRLSTLILHRLRDRYITPLENVPDNLQSGFLIMAASCLMIEAFQCFREGKKDTKGCGKATFKNFFSDYRTAFPGIDGEEFYEKIRCGILHQAQTHGCFRILQTGAIYDEEEKTINALLFLNALKKTVEGYVQSLRLEDMHSASWVNARQKIGYIIEVIEKG